MIRRPFMAMCIAGVAGIAGALILPVWAGLILLPLSVCIIIKNNKTVTRTAYVFWITVFLIVGFCRVWSGKALDTLNRGMDAGRILEIDGEYYGDGSDLTCIGCVKKVAEKKNSLWITLRTSGGEVLAILSKTKIPEETTFYKGQIYEVTGEIKPLTPATNPGQFDEVTYYRSLGILCKIQVDHMTLFSEGDWGHRSLRWLEILRDMIGNFYQENMSDSGAGVMMAAVLGDRSGFGEDTRRVWQQNGWMHLVTVSGLHLSFIAMGIYRRMRKMTAPLAVASVLAFFAMLAYGYMTDFGDSMIRACIMMTLCIVAVLAGRRYDRPTALAFSAWMMLMLRPERIYNSGFILSFMAIIGTLLSPGALVDGTSFKKLSKPMKLRVRLTESLNLQTGIFLSTLPVIAVTMYEIPILGFFYNLFMIPLVSLLVPLSFAAGMAGASGSGVIQTVSGWIMVLVDTILGLVVRLPAKTWVSGCPKAWQLAGYLLLISLWIVLKYKMNIKRFCIKLIPVAAVVLLIGIRDHTDRILFLDVGQGDGICFMSADGETVMLDGGSSSEKDIWQYRIAPALKYYGREKVDVWLLTHGDEDHTSGIHDALCDPSCRIGAVLCSEIKESEEMQRIQTEAKASGVNMLEMLPLQTLTFDHFELTCLYPDKGSTVSDENDRSLVVSLTYKKKNYEFNALFTGDLGISGENILLQRLEQDISYDLLKAGHHGSKTSTSEALLKKIKPLMTVISCGVRNRYGHPHKETLERLKWADTQILRTDRMGAIEVIFDRKGWYVVIYTSEVDD